MTSNLAAVLEARKLRGDQSRRSHVGNVAERLAGTMNEACERAGIAVLDRVPTPMAVLGKASRPPGAVVARYARRASVDYLGIMADGRGVAVECKHVAPTAGASGLRALRFPLDRIEPHQRARLAFYARAGGVALVLVLHGEIAAYAAPWRVVAGVLEAGERASLSAADLEPWRVGREPYLARWARKDG